MITRRSLRPRSRAVLATLATLVLLCAPVAATPSRGRVQADTTSVEPKILPDRFRGANLLFGQNNFDPTTEIPRYASYGMNVVRLMLNTDSVDNNGLRFIGPFQCVDANGVLIEPSPATDPTAPYRGNLARIDATLAVLGHYGMKAIIVADHTYCRGAGIAGGLPAYWEPVGQPLRDHVVALWGALAAKYASNPTVVGFDILNEPDQEFVANGSGAAFLQSEYDAYYKDLVPRGIAAIRANDPSAWITIEPAPLALPVGYQNVGGFGPSPTITTPPPPISATIQPYTDTANTPPHIIYSWHDYTPATYTGQSQSAAQGSTPLTYPGMATNYDDPANSYWDKAALQRYFGPVRQWQMDHKYADGSLPRIWVGEMGAERWEPNASGFYSDTLSIFEGWGWDWTFHDPANSSEWNPTFTPSDTQTGAPYGDVYTDRLRVMLHYWGLNAHTASYQSIALPHPQGDDQPYYTDFSGAADVDPERGETQGIPPGWQQVAPPGNSNSLGLSSVYSGTVASGSLVTGTLTGELIHYLPSSAPSTNPAYLQYARQSYGLTNTLYMQAFLDPGTTLGSASHLAIRDVGNDEVDVAQVQDGSLSYSIRDGLYAISGTVPATGASASPALSGSMSAAAPAPGFPTSPAVSPNAATVRADISPTAGVTIYRNGTVVATVAHAFAHLGGYKLELRGINGYATDLTTAPQIQIYADDVAISHVASDLPTRAPDLAVASADITITPVAPVQGDQGTISATIHNVGGPAAASVTRFYDGDPAAGGVQIGSDVPTPALPAGGAATVGVTWNTRKAAGVHTLYVVADATTSVGDTNRANNTASIAVTVRKNKAKNGDMEDAGAAQPGQPDGWTPSSSATASAPGGGGPAGMASWDATTSTAGGTHALELAGNGSSATLEGAPAWVSDPISVTPGEVDTLSAWIQTRGASSSPSVRVQYLSTTGAVVSTLTALAPALPATAPFGPALTTVAVPADPTIAQARLVLAGFAPTDTATAGTVWFDDVQLYH